MTALRFRRACVAGVGAAALGISMLGTIGSAQAMPTRDGRVAPACASGGARTAHQHARDTEELSAAQVRHMEADLTAQLRSVPQAQARATASTPVTIPVAVHVIRPDASTHEVGPQRALRQVRITSRGYAGRQDPTAFATPFRFKMVSFDSTVNSRWYTTGPNTASEHEMKRALHIGDAGVLNVYFNKPSGGVLGWATFPQWYDNHKLLDGVVINIESMKGGAATGYNRGDTLTHEAGHWLGLYHTFQGGCSRSNDHVTDTPTEAGPNFTCPQNLDTCKAAGLDPIHNFMDYSYDPCMYAFTRGQSERMVLSYLAYRR
ncbi:MAG: zinc metalloprotease [Nocardioidaceae bacterium]